ncbi:MAG TPA: glycosyltransferase [Candidatus Dormibacteraeota bacterium]|nr:glycosyltransferase [Candidatus Dormibacteraeota bacterium]
MSRPHVAPIETRPEPAAPTWQRPSAARTVTRGQVATAAALALACGVLAWLDLISSLIALMAATTLAYAVLMAFKSLVTVDALRRGPVKVSAEELAELDPASLPTYTILVPLYKEATVVRRLLTSLRRLDYPRDRLQVLLLCEADDAATLEALNEANPGRPFEIVRVPPSYPRTKPKVCNIGLERARGQYLVIYDAEDRPAPDQLKKAVAAFRELPRNVVCLQAKLEYRNPDTNLLTRFFAAEYGTFFDMLLPSLARRGLPVPLGGTSNHFRTAALRALGGWDSYNVTEDLDLGMWIARRRWRVEILDSITWEEANSHLGNWVRQRSRWLKGYMQTYLVHMRSPVRLWRELGTGSFLAFQLLVGATPLTTLVNPALWVLTLVYGVTGSPLIQQLFPAPVYYVGITSMVLGNFVFAYYLVTGCLLLGNHRNAKWMLAAPLYWLLMSVAAWKAAVQVVLRPHYWEKTRHGLVEEGHGEPVEDGGGWRPRPVPGGVARHGVRPPAGGAATGHERPVAPATGR